MGKQNRRQWLQKSLLASSTLLTGGVVARPFHEFHSSDYLNRDYLPLHWNENPYGPSPMAINAVAEIAKKGNRYPDDAVQAFKEKLSAAYNLSTKNVMITAGSMELLALLGQHVGLQGGEIISPWASFPTLLSFGEQTGASVKRVPLREDDTLDLDGVLANINEKTSLVFICNPNNPTSTEVDQNELKAFCKKVPEHILVVVDEAYIEFSKLGAKGSMIPLVSELPNLVICRTFSKAYGLAGFRIGYGVSQEKNIKALSSRHLGFELSAGIAPLAAATAAIDDQSYMLNGVTKNEQGRQIIYAAFDKWGIEYNDSSTNFIYAKSDGFQSDLVAKLKEDKILITKWPGIMKNHIRISISELDHMDKFVKNAAKYLS